MSLPLEALDRYLASLLVRYRVLLGGLLESWECGRRDGPVVDPR